MIAHVIVDNGHLCCMSSVVLLGQSLHSLLLPAGIPAPGATTIYHLCTLHLLYCLLLAGLWDDRRPVQLQKQDLGDHGPDELLRRRTARLRHWRFGYIC